MAETRPHITVGHHDRYSVVAATSHDNHVAEHILRLVGFERLPGSTLYGLTDPHRAPVRRGAQGVQSLRAAQYSVTSDAVYDLQPHTRLSAGRGLLDRLEKPSAPSVSTAEEAAFASAHTLDAEIQAGRKGSSFTTKSAFPRAPCARWTLTRAPARVSCSTVRVTSAMSRPGSRAQTSPLMPSLTSPATGAPIRRPRPSSAGRRPLPRSLRLVRVSRRHDISPSPSSTALPPTAPQPVRTR